jgi:uncharacterized beta barrel domain-containing protein DUF5777
VKLDAIVRCGSERARTWSVVARRCRRVIGACLILNGAVGAASGQSLPGPTIATSTESTGRLQTAEDDAVPNRAEPDLVVVNLPTAMRLPLFKSNFRLTHRFAGNLKRGTFGQQASSLFGIDQGAIIGFEYRVAVARQVQASFYRSSFDRTIQLHGKYDAIRQRRSMPASISALASVEGTNNFREKYAPSFGVVVSRTVGTRVAAYLTPIWTGNTTASLEPIAHDDGGERATTAEGPEHQSTTSVGVGARVRVRGSTYVAAEIVPRASGYAPDQPAYGVSIEKRVGSHMFSLTFTNTFGTTYAQVARGGATNTLYLGFNLGRKFY